MIKNILIITSSFDKTVDFIIEKFTNTKFIRLNVDELDKYKISVNSNLKNKGSEYANLFKQRQKTWGTK